MRFILAISPGARWRISRACARSAAHRVTANCLRDEFLNETLFTSLMQARLALEDRRRDYNHVRPHSNRGAAKMVRRDLGVHHAPRFRFGNQSLEQKIGQGLDQSLRVLLHGYLRKLTLQLESCA